MASLPESIVGLIAALNKLPGVGPRESRTDLMKAGADVAVAAAKGKAENHNNIGAKPPIPVNNRKG